MKLPMKIGAAVMLLLMIVVEGAGPASGPDVLVDKQVHLGIPGQWE